MRSCGRHRAYGHNRKTFALNWTALYQGDTILKKRNTKHKNQTKGRQTETQRGLHSKGYSPPWKFPVVNFHSDSSLNNTWIPHDLYHQNIQLSMKQESLTHLPSEHRGRHCAPRWNNSSSICSNRLEILVSMLFWRQSCCQNILLLGLDGAQRGFIHMCLWGCVTGRD